MRSILSFAFAIKGAVLARSIACLSAVLLLAGTVGAATIAVPSGDFETPFVNGNPFAQNPGPPWTYTSLAYIGTIESTQAGMVQFATGFPTSSISQTLADFQPGVLTTVNFDIRSRIGFGPAPIEVFLGGVSMGTVTPSASATNFQGVSFSLPSVAAGSNLLEFRNIVPLDTVADLSTYIDNVTITQVPEPAAAVLLGLAAMGLVRVARRRQA